MVLPSPTQNFAMSEKIKELEAAAADLEGLSAPVPVTIAPRERTPMWYEHFPRAGGAEDRVLVAAGMH